MPVGQKNEAWIQIYLWHKQMAIAASCYSSSTHSHIWVLAFLHILSLICSLFLLFFFADNYFIDDYARFSTLDSKEKSTAVANSMNYMTKKGKQVY